MICRIKVISIGLRPEIMGPLGNPTNHGDRKSTRLNSSHGYISYAVFCLKKKKTLLVIPQIVFCHLFAIHIHFFLTHLQAAYAATYISQSQDSPEMVDYMVKSITGLFCTS